MPVTAAVIVTTPQQLSFVDVVKGIQMFDTVKVPTVGVVENMSYYEVNGEKHRIFGQGAKDKLVDQFGFRHTFEIPIDPRLSSDGDAGTPMVSSRPADPISNRYYEIAEAIHGEINLLVQHGGTPVLTYNVGQNCELTFPDGRILEIPPAELRFACRCALCVSETTGEKLIRREDIDPDVYPETIKPVGNYASAVTWSDGHKSSIYPHDLLIELFDGTPETSS